MASRPSRRDDGPRQPSADASRTQPRLPRDLIERRIPWPRQRHWRPGEPVTLTERGRAVTYRLRGVMRDPDPASDFATVTLERLRVVSLGDDDAGEIDDLFSAAG